MRDGVLQGAEEKVCQRGIVVKFVLVEKGGPFKHESSGEITFGGVIILPGPYEEIPGAWLVNGFNSILSDWLKTKQGAEWMRENKIGGGK